MPEPEPLEAFDAVVIGTGFGGSVVACRLAQAGYKICVLERGRRYTSSEPDPARPDVEPSSDFPALPPPDRTMPDLARWRWGADQGLWDVRDLGAAHCVQSAGYGGGSLVYANVHLRAPAAVFQQGWPDAYTPAKLAPYYDLVASMLDVKPITEARFGLIKTDQMKRVASAIGQDRGLFYPPLTINFKSGKNEFGVEQSACRACAECDTGCRYRAKNTLDLNYLAVVDKEPKAQVRTLAEALLISRVNETDEVRYEVEYRDHLQGRERVRIAARSVFVCAGAVGTTELLLRCRDAAQSSAGRRGLPGLLHANALGQGFFLNADALGIVYDARLPAKDGTSSGTAPALRGGASSSGAAPRRVDATTGPVITTCITYQGDQGKPWFMLQDGGFPRAFARHVGLMRAPLWLRRNRFGVDAGTDPRLKIRVVDASDAAALKLPQAPQPVPLGDAGGIAGGPLTSIVDGLWALVRDGELAKTVPPAVHKAFDALEAEAKAALDTLLSTTVQDVRVGLREQNVQWWLRVLTPWWCKPAPWVERLVRGILRWLYDAFAGQQKVLAVTQDSLDTRYDLKSRPAMTARASRYLLGFSDEKAEHSEHSMVLLAMGRDDAHGRLSLDDHGEAQLALHLTPRADVYSMQERLMRDAARALSGRLRTSPSWAFGRKPITVHAQGGCAMSSAPDKGVTSADGAVHGCVGLYVMDGSVIPTAVGVNPSATIAAIAERNIRIFIRDNPCSALTPDWDDENQRRAVRWTRSSQQWLRRTNGEPPALLEPPVVSSAPPQSPAIGVEFQERMSGFLSAHAPPHGPAEFEAAELEGRRQGCSIELELTAKVLDIAAFIEDGKHELAVTGSAQLRGFSGDGPVVHKVSGEMQLFPGTHARARRTMEYRLTLTPANGGGPRYAVKGTKYISDDPGPDAWRDTTALFVTATQAGAAAGAPIPARHGVLHVALDQFVYQQMPSYIALGTDDPARTIWAVSAFVGYFFGSLQRVYLPQLGRAVDLLSEIKLR